MNNTIRCPHCGKTVEISEAFRHEVEDKIRLTERQKIEEEKQELLKKAKQENDIETETLKKQVIENEKKINEYRENELKLRTDKRKLEEEKKDIDLVIARKMDEERKKIEETVTKQILEQRRLKEQEKDKIINDLKVSLEDAQRKAQQGSQQLQGEVQELDLELTLKQEFPYDIIEPVEKGEKGADLRQIVKTERGNICGVILWESKRTKAWSDGWLMKLKEDLRNSKAHLAIIVSSILPKDLNSGMGTKDNQVYICNYSLVLPLATILRQKLREVAHERFLAQKKEGKSSDVYEYITGHEFRQQVQAMFEIYKEMNEQINKERTAFEKIWKMRESQIGRLQRGNAQVIGSLQGIIGPSFNQIKGLDLDLLEDGNEKNGSEKPIQSQLEIGNNES